MTTEIATLDNDWITDCRINAMGSDDTLETWIVRATNCPHVEITDDGAVWIGRNPHEGKWLSQDDLDELVAKIDAGV